MFRVLQFAGAFLFAVNYAAASNSESFYVSFKDFKRIDDSLLVKGPWRYVLENISNGADPSLNDSSWSVTSETLQIPPGWNESGWFRIRLLIDPKLRDKTVALTIRHGGDIRVYLDGKMLFEFHKKLSLDRNPLQVRFDESPEHLLTVFYSNPDPNFLLSKNMAPGFYLAFKDLNTTMKYLAGSVYHFVFLCGILLAFSLTHCFIYLSDMREKLHLFFALFCILIAIMIISELADVLISRTEVLYLRRCWGAGQLLLNMVFLRFTYMIFGLLLPRRYYAYCAAGAVLLIWGWNRLGGAWFNPAAASHYISIHTLIGLIEVIFIFLTRRTKRENILVLGAIPLVLTAIYQMFINFALVPPFTLFLDYVPLPYYAFLSLLITMSLYLSQNIARANRDLQKQVITIRELSDQKLEQERRARVEEIEHKLLEADHRRKTEELEEARKLQLSLLPESGPKVPGLEIAFYMKTATEVGGDYYDFYESGDSLTVVIGDATGHGAQAGIMVTAVKGLFLSLAAEENIPRIFSQISQTLNAMKLGRMYMALSMAKLSNRILRIASAGMPPAYLCGPGGSVKVLQKSGIPLGLRSYQYTVFEHHINPGEAIVLMSDGFPEMFNSRNEILGYDRVPEILTGIADKTPEDIIHHLIDAGSHWSDGAQLNDDVTFVVLKVVDSKL